MQMLQMRALFVLQRYKVALCLYCNGTKWHFVLQRYKVALCFYCNGTKQGPTLSAVHWMVDTCTVYPKTLSFLKPQHYSLFENPKLVTVKTPKLITI
jgi:hypothetical protein